MPSLHPLTTADLLVQRLHSYEVSHVFGYPGGPLAPLYDALYRRREVRHILARDEQAAAFMADGYARATGKPGVCLAVCGPGVFNALTPLATAFSDSVPVLLLSGQVPPSPHGARSGYYHENEQLSVCKTVTKGRTTVRDPSGALPELDRAWRFLTEGRPGPVLLEVPGEVLRAEILSPQPLTLMPPGPPRAPSKGEVEALVRLIESWKRPLLLAGGGCLAADATDELRQAADRLGAPVFHTLNGKSAFPADHPLAAGLPWNRGTSDARDMDAFMSPLFAEADGLLAIGCRFAQVATGTWALKPPKSLVHIDLDAAEIGRHYPVTLGIQADAREALKSLLDHLPREPRPPWATIPSNEPWLLHGENYTAALRRALPRDAILVADVTQMAYRLLVEFPVFRPRTFLHPAGSVAMGYALPAALGAKAALPQRAVVAVMGDGGFQMSAMELATAVQERLPVVVVLFNDGGLTLIRSLQERKYGARHLGVELRNPDFGTFAAAFGVRHWGVATATELERAVREALATGEPGLVEVRLNGQGAGRS